MCVCTCVRMCVCMDIIFTFVSVVLMLCFFLVSVMFLSVVRGERTQQHVLCKYTYITYHTIMLQHTSHLSLTCYVADLTVPAHSGKAI